MEGLKLIGRRLKYKAHRVKIYEDELIKPDGKKVYYDFVENRNGSGVLLIDGEGRLILVKQFRNSISDYDIEIPAGCVEIDDNPVELENHEFIQKDFTNKDNPFYKCALREAEEETGLIPNKLFFINYIIAAVGLFSERTAVYIGTEINILLRNIYGVMKLI